MRRSRERLPSPHRAGTPARGAAATPTPPPADTDTSRRGAAGPEAPASRPHLPARRPLFALAAAACGALAVVAATVLLLADRQLTVGPNVFVNPPAQIDAHNSPSVVRNPRDPDNLVVVNRIDRPRFNAALHWSADGGRVWRSTAHGAGHRPAARGLPDRGVEPPGCAERRLLPH